MARENDNSANLKPSLYGFLRHVYRPPRQTKKPRIADLLFGIPLFGGLTVGLGYKLWTDIEVGNLIVFRNVEVTLSEHPFWFGVAVVMNILIILALGNMVRAIFVEHWRTWFHSK